MTGPNKGATEGVVGAGERQTGDPPPCALWAIADYRCDFQQISGKSRLVVFRAHQPLYVEACEGPDAGFRRAAILRERLETGLPLVPDRLEEQVARSSTFNGHPHVAASFLMEAPAESLEPAVVRTDLVGFIVEANEAAARLLITIRRGDIRLRKFLWFFLHARDALLAAQQAAARGETCTVETMVRPDEGRAVIMSMKVTRVGNELWWTMSPPAGTL
jgi:PAS domain-containing protein